MHRLFSATAFLAAALAFALPFGAVSSCDGEEVRFTGLELATFSVQPDESQQGTLHTDVERPGGAFALAALIAVLVGLVFVLGRRSGAGVCASLGLISLQLVLWAVLTTSDGGQLLFVGFWLSLGCVALAALLQLARAARRRRHLGRSWRGFAVGRTVLVLLPSIALVALVAIAVASG